MYDVYNMPDLVNRYFSSDLWFYAFIASVIYLFVRLNTARKRAFLAGLFTFFLVINAFVIKLCTAMGENPTFYRHLWTIPSMTIIGIAVVDLIKLLPKWYLRTFVIITFAVGLYFVNSQEYIRCKGLYYSKDAKMVSDDIIVLDDGFKSIRSNVDKQRLFVVCPSGYANQYGDFDAEIETYIGFLNVYDSSLLTNEGHNGEEELTGGSPDVHYIMSTCCGKGIDYIIVSRNENNKQIYSEFGYNPIITSENYLVYACSGYYGYKQDENKEGKVNWIRWYDNNNIPIMNEKGYCRIEYEYDNRGRIIKETYKDTEDALIDIENGGYGGYAICEYKYSKYGIAEMKLLDSNGRPCIRQNYGYSIIRYTCNNIGQIVEERYYNEKDELFNFDGNIPRAITRFIYDDEGNVISEKHFDKNDQPSKALYGYDEIRKEYDANHNIIRQGFYADGKLINRSDTGYAEIMYQYNESDEIIDIQYYDVNGLLVDSQTE